MMLDTVTTGNSGRLSIGGLVFGLNTSGYTDGDTIFLSDTVAGGYQNTPPANIYRQRIGFVANASASVGVVLVSPVGIMPPVFTSTVPGSVPASGGGTTNFLRGDGTWAAPTTISGLAGSATILATGRTIGMTGDVTWTTPTFNGSANVTAVGTIANNAVDNAKAADMATARIKGRVTAATGDPEDLTGTQATTLLDTFTSGLKGLAPASGGGTTNFLRADGTWGTPAGGTPANPTATVGPTAVNGVATTYMRSDAAPAINLAANYTWTGAQDFSLGTGVIFASGAIAVPSILIDPENSLEGLLLFLGLEKQ